MVHVALHYNLRSVIKFPESLTLAQRAAKYTKEQVAEFLKSIGLAQYVDSFLEDDVDGELMSEANDEDLDALGVQSQLHKIKIMVLFKRHVVGKSARLGGGRELCILHRLSTRGAIGTLSMSL